MVEEGGCTVWDEGRGSGRQRRIRGEEGPKGEMHWCQTCTLCTGLEAQGPQAPAAGCLLQVRGRQSG